MEKICPCIRQKKRQTLERLSSAFRTLIGSHLGKQLRLKEGGFDARELLI